MNTTEDNATATESPAEPTRLVRIYSEYANGITDDAITAGSQARIQAARDSLAAADRHFVLTRALLTEEEQIAMAKVTDAARARQQSAESQSNHP